MNLDLKKYPQVVVALVQQISAVKTIEISEVEVFEYNGWSNFFHKDLCFLKIEGYWYNQPPKVKIKKPITPKTTSTGRPRGMKYPKFDFKSKKDKCYYCKNTAEFLAKGNPKYALTKDHVYPRSKGGILTMNFVWSCLECNQSKSNMTLIEWKDFILTNKATLPTTILNTIEFMLNKLKNQKHYDKMLNNKDEDSLRNNRP